MNKDYPIFIDNEYTDEYLSICRNAISRGDTGEYFEEHMIIPQDFLRFYKPEKKEYCRLTPEEHWRCHELLKEMFVDEKHRTFAHYNFWRIGTSQPEAKDDGKYGELQREKNKHWESMQDEIEKYH